MGTTWAPGSEVDGRSLNSGLSEWSSSEPIQCYKIQQQGPVTLKKLLDDAVEDNTPGYVLVTLQMLKSYAHCCHNVVSHGLVRTLVCEQHGPGSNSLALPSTSCTIGPNPSCITCGALGVWRGVY